MSSRNLKILGLIGARSGSKGMPHKNIAPFAGKPLMAWIIETAKRSRYINRLVLSTDSFEYAEVGKKFGAEIPFLRPEEFSTDESPEVEYVEHALRWLEENERYRPDLVVRVLPTLPLQTADDIDACVAKILNDNEAHSCMVVAETKQPLNKALMISDDGNYLVSALTKSGRDANPSSRQKHPATYFRANVIAVRPEVVLNEHSLSGERVLHHVISRDRAIDIDSPTDLFLAEQLFKKFAEQ
ncbi:hypothetical protein A2926_03490 [Candidatus Giovannonibacteria bacterium RIFCSPLOWO2_01_FULL_44_40]|uniref:Acylneuraminate cytidylyltransferase n=1 Tax=Candidatus Giovannonibacteria bacterium RIFCSPHIGHO2_01_FULL_45_23 TaxID=1798325 RepID=A0A1F5VGX8_9BACT|nr:MAG: hypothetical protein A2834_03465 [Candidatus Giovannonibacteria bacterium RIFCSPHIGHO2_01_FULL_45_23]OGF75698.1 MAG: hypothetical protein A3C77_01745 [Candidatus Giovannonibacteria bacterium RIFCSPHIGHO2_02_FULL_45_13]OGF79824.1 MAG: hypothetical protein A2926_03490 [Candidatus Giovannonibacteria bacterium RIFCSPLOWO2_01_FULL_44_40]